MKRRSSCLAALLAVCAALFQACCSGPKATDEPAIVRTETPSYADVVTRYNTRVERFTRLRAYSVVRIAYKDNKNELHNEQGEGILQVVRPDRLALSIKKAGKMLFWFGCDDQRYWWIDLLNDRVANVGRHDRLGARGNGPALVPIQPLDLIRLLGIVPLDPAAAGKTRWSDNGRLLIVEGPATGAVAQRLMLNPDSLEPTRIELVSADGTAFLSADLSQYEGADLEGIGGLKPRIATHLEAQHPASQTGIKLDLSEISDANINDQAFSFDDVVRSLGVQKIVDVDAPQTPPPGGRQ